MNLFLQQCYVYDLGFESIEEASPILSNEFVFVGEGRREGRSESFSPHLHNWSGSLLSVDRQEFCKKFVYRVNRQNECVSVCIGKKIVVLVWYRYFVIFFLLFYLENIFSFFSKKCSQSKNLIVFIFSPRSHEVVCQKKQQQESKKFEKPQMPKNKDEHGVWACSA